MLIRCKIERKNGTTVQLDGNTYRFAPMPSRGIAAHVCNVEKPGHIRRLVSEIPEGYEAYLGDETPNVSPEAMTSRDGGRSLPDPAQGGAPNPDPAPQSVAPVTPKPAGTALTPDPDATASDDKSLAEMDRDELIARYAKLAGRKPNGKAADDTLRAKIAEMEAEISE
jgi:hypothetical protein